MKKEPKTYEQYKAEAKNHQDSIMAKYGMPPGAKPPMEKNVIPASSDRHYRKYAFTYKRRLEEWPTSGRKR